MGTAQDVNPVYAGIVHLVNASTTFQIRCQERHAIDGDSPVYAGIVARTVLTS